MAAFILILLFCRSIKVLGHKRTKKVLLDEESESTTPSSLRALSPDGEKKALPPTLANSSGMATLAETLVVLPEVGSGSPRNRTTSREEKREL